MNAGHTPSGLTWMFTRNSPEALKAEEERLAKQLHQLKVELEVSHQLLTASVCTLCTGRTRVGAFMCCIASCRHALHPVDIQLSSGRFKVTNALVCRHVRQSLNDRLECANSNRLPVS